MTDSQDQLNDRWQDAVKSVRLNHVRPELVIEEVPAPNRLAPFALALAVDAVSADDKDLASGRFVVLHDPEGQPTWDGDFRIVTFVKAGLESDVLTGDMFDEVAWTWLVESLSDHDAVMHNLSGTVTRTVSRSFADLRDREIQTDLEIRASWTPETNDLSHHIQAWLGLIEICADLQPLPAGVTAIAKSR